ncbi:EKA-like protein [Blumeria hordei DH14]|uniref:EKA-like protein n=2 Tax=Blumeria hordei TaxID=2867405 RepID=N1J585_BLUG1|nr:EKA-like protein [Blumeria hordei DH14]
MTQIISSEGCKPYDPFNPHAGQDQIYVQLVLSFVLGTFAFISFCFLRTRWKSLYAGRKQQNGTIDCLPDLPDSFFGWIPVLYNVTDEQVLKSAGLDAYVFLAFFKMSIKLFTTILIVTCIIVVPINSHFVWLPSPADVKDPRQEDRNISQILTENSFEYQYAPSVLSDENKNNLPDPTYLWAYAFFTYLFSGLAIYFLSAQTKSIIKVRQRYLGSQPNVKSRTFKLSGIPLEFRTEDKIKEMIESLEIGKVLNVTIARNLEKLDLLVKKRHRVLRLLEESLVVYQGKQNHMRRLENQNPTPIYEADGGNHNEEGHALLGNTNTADSEDLEPRITVSPQTLCRRNSKIDAIHFYEEELMDLDDEIRIARKEVYPTTPIAFVTMDSISASQIAVQTLLESSMNLTAKLAAAPTEILWYNTYRSRCNRMIRSWMITIFIFVLTIFWVVPVAALAGLIDLCSIQKVWPQLADVLTRHEILKSLVQTGLPTLIVSLLNLCAPFLYDFLSYKQGKISQVEIELSVISKNFFFIFFNVFLTFTVAGTATKFWSTLQDTLKDTTFLAFKLAGSVQEVAVFYLNFIILQGIGLTPLRLLEFGSMSLYPFFLMASKTPRDYAEFMQPPIFKYGFYLPSAIFIYILCIVYSILPVGYLILIAGIIYFINSYFTYKYQLLYAMDHYKHETGGAWPMICYRVHIGLGIFQIVMAGIIALKSQIYAAITIVPLIFFNIWYSYYFSRTHHPLMNFIALKSIQKEVNAFTGITDENIAPENIFQGVNRTLFSNSVEGKESQQFMNSNLTAPLASLWINSQPESNNGSTFARNGVHNDFFPNNSRGSSLLSLGDTHVWREND